MLIIHVYQYAYGIVTQCHMESLSLYRADDNYLDYIRIYLESDLNETLFHLQRRQLTVENVLSRVLRKY